jgi:hypothetical protein
LLELHTKLKGATRCTAQIDNDDDDDDDDDDARAAMNDSSSGECGDV